MAQRVSYSLRKRVNLTYRPRKKGGESGDPVSLGIGFSKCGCSPDAPAKNCRNRSTYVIDYQGGKPVTLKECPNRFDDAELWRDIHFALYVAKDWQGLATFAGPAIPPMLFSPEHYDFFEACFAARDRYQQQKADKG